MKHISLTQDKFTIVDDDMYEYLSQWKWQVTKGGNNYYAMSRIKNKTVYMHRLVNNTPKGFHTDHINHNSLDNRKYNLRTCTTSQNLMNSKPVNKTSKYKGVHYFARDKNWQAQIMLNYKHYHLGYFDDEIEAARAYDAKAKELFGEYARLNFEEAA